MLIPGLVNAHTHAAMTLFRGLADDLPLDAWLRERIWPVERRFVSAEFVRDGTELAIAEMLRAGITCFSDQYFFPEIVAQTAVELGMRAMIGTPVVDFATAWASDAAKVRGSIWNNRSPALNSSRATGSAAVHSCVVVRGTLTPARR